MTTITKEWLQQTIAEFENTRDDIPFGLSDDDAKILIVLKQTLAALTAEPVRYLNKFSGTCVTLEQQSNAADDVAVYMPLYAAPPASEREQVRREHAEWSDKTFGDVGPVGPLKHLSKEALETAAEPDDLSEWADMQFLLWDAQRRAGISDEQITLAMVEKLAVNKKREWPEPKDGEPRLHIKEQPAPVVPDEMATSDDMNLYQKSFAQGWNACRAAMLQGGEQPQNARQNIPDGNSPVSPDGWISCSERMPDNDESKPIAIFTGKCLGQGMFVATYDDDGFFDCWEGMEIIGVSHWMPLPEPPQEVNRG
ncbi:TPA: dATP/dGTP pyrophosphohydrolase domain-containing protein [Salmonella enterica subsp. enterica serovar Schwarzengrund]